MRARTSTHTYLQTVVHKRCHTDAHVHRSVWTDMHTWDHRHTYAHVTHTHTHTHTHGRLSATKTTTDALQQKDCGGLPMTALQLVITVHTHTHTVPSAILTLNTNPSYNTNPQD